MEPDFLFVAAGTAVVLLAGWLLCTSFRPAQHTRRLAALLWSVFGIGLLLQGFAPHLQIAHNQFLMPPGLLAHSRTIHPADIVARERWMQTLSSLLSCGAAFGLALHYRRLFLPARSPPARDHPGQPPVSR